MKLLVEVISKEIIKPASPIPDDIPRYQLSFLDQLGPDVYIPLVLFYPKHCSNKSNTTETYSNHLKRSLSQTLTLYYPLSGRLRGNDHVDCNSETGVPYMESHVKCQLAKLVDDPVPDELTKLLPFELDHEGNDLLLGVQFNVFECGGVVLGLCLSHKVADASSLSSFIRSWSSIARGEGRVQRPEFVSAVLFSPVDITGFSPRTGIAKENVVAKRFLFRAASIEALKSKYATSPSLKDQPAPTRVEILSMFIGRRLMAATEIEQSPSKVFFIVHAVNLRTRMDPPLSENTFGNLYRPVLTFPSPQVHEDYCGSLIRQVRDSIRKVDKEEVKRLQQGKEYLAFMKKQGGRFNRGEIVSLSFSSWCRFPLYEADLGWGKPFWVGAPSLTFCNLVVFMDTASGDGIEALVHLKGEDMNKFEMDEELLQYSQR